MQELGNLNQLPEKKKMDIQNPIPEVVNGLDVNSSPRMEPEQPTYNNIPTETIDLPSKGLLYPEGSELAKGQIRMKYMTAREEDILTNQTLIKKGTVLDELFKSMIISPIKYDDLLIGDKNAIIVWARILSYGSTYDIEVTTPSGKQQQASVDLMTLKSKELKDDVINNRGQNRFKFTTSKGNVIEFKLLTIKDEREIEEKINAMKKIGQSANLSSRLRQMILSVDGNDSPGYISEFISTRFLAIDTREFRKYVNEIQPNIDMSIELADEDTGDTFPASITVGLDFFWPDSGA